MINQANKHRSDRVFEIDMWVYLKLEPHRQVTIRKEHQHKLSSKKFSKTGVLPHCGPNGLLSAEPVAILDRRLAKVNNKAVSYVLVKWSNHTDEDATWENYADLIQRYPEFEKTCLRTSIV
ncbi:retrotransposable element Tf2 [Tanacetum coccineum]